MVKKMKKYFAAALVVFIIMISCAKKGNLLTTPSAAVTATPGAAITNTPGVAAPVKYYGGAEYDYNRGSTFCPDGYVMAVFSNSYSNGNYDACLIKTDLSGNFLWEKIFGGIYDDLAMSVKSTSDGGFILAGMSDNTGESNVKSDFLLIKTDGSGNKLWERKFGNGIDGYSGNSVAEAQDGGYFCAGNTNGSPPNGYIVKVDTAGNTLWTQSYPDYRLDWYDCIVPTADNGAVITGVLNSSNNVYMSKLDVSGNVQWTKVYSDYKFDSSSVRRTADSGYLIAGDNYSGTFSEAAMIKTDALGNCVWAKSYDILGTNTQNEAVNGAMEDSSGNFVITGSVNYNQVFVLKTDASGNKLWGKTFLGGSFNNDGNYILQSPDNNYIVTGTTMMYGMLGSVFIMKLEAATGNQVW